MRLSRLLLTVLSALPCLTWSVVGQNASKPEVPYPLVHVPKWRVEYTLTSGGRQSKEINNVEAYHMSEWSIAGSAILESETEAEPGSTGSAWEGLTDSTGDVHGEFGAVTPLACKYLYQGPVAFSATESSPDDNRFLLQIDAERKQYDVMLVLRVEGEQRADCSEVKSRAKEASEFFEQLEQPESASLFFNPSLEHLPLPADSAGGISGSRLIGPGEAGTQVSIGTGALVAVPFTFSWTITPYDASKDLQVDLEVCEGLAVGQKTMATARAKPAGGKYRYWVEPPSTLSIKGDGPTAEMTAIGLGEATLYAEYTAPDGKQKRASSPVSSLSLNSINEGQPIPKIGLFGSDGKPTEEVLTVPVSVEPSGLDGFLIYAVGDEAVLSVANEGDSIAMQGLRLGKTTVQAKTECGGPTGAAVAVEVVRCSDKVLKELAEEERIVDEAFAERMREDARIRGNKDFEKAAAQIGEATADLAFNTAALIATAAGSVGGAEPGVKAASTAFDTADNVLKVLKGEPGSAALGTALQVAEKDLLSFVYSANGTLDSANTFGDYLGTLMGTASQLEANRQRIEEWSRKKEDVVRRKKICRTGGEPAPPQPEPNKPGPKPRPQPPQPPPSSTPKPTVPPSRDPNPPEPPADQPPGEGPVSPPPPISPPRQSGLPYGEADCGCGQNQELASSPKGLEAVRMGMETVNQCVVQFKVEQINPYVQTLERLQAAVKEIGMAAGTAEPERTSRLQAVIPEIEAGKAKIAEFQEAGQRFEESFKKCPQDIGGATELLRTPIQER